MDVEASPALEVAQDLVPAVPAVAARPRRGRTAYLTFAAVIAVALGGYGLFAFLTRGQEATDDAQVEADVVTLSARVGAPVLKVFVKDNQAVKQDDPLVDLDPTDFEIRVAQAEAEREAARAQAAAAAAQLGVVEAQARGGLTLAKAQVSGSAGSVHGADAQVAAARAGLARARSDAARLHGDLDRALRLAGEGAIPKGTLDTAQFAADAADAQVSQAEAQLEAAQDLAGVARTRIGEAEGKLTQSESVDAQLEVARAARDLADARVKAAEAALRQARQQLAYTHITAPFDGVLSRLSVHTGQLVQPASVVAALVPNESYLVGNFKETQVAHMREGQRVRITIDTFPGETFWGHLVSLSPATGARFSLLPPDNATGNFVKVVQRVPVKIAWDHPPTDRIHAGLSADVTVYTR